MLGGYADGLNVRVQAPLAHRIKWVLEQQQMAGPSEAEAAVKEADEVRSAFIEDFYHVGWDLARAFDLVLDTRQAFRPSSRLPPSSRWPTGWQNAERTVGA